jgi:PPM family protein phosphatase
VQVGDSRAYLYRQGVLTQLTRDQTIANSLQALHKEMKTDTKFAEMLVQAVGAVEKVDVEVSKASLEPGDCVLICCDGLYKSVDDGSIAEVLGSGGTLIGRGKELIARANSAGGPDNITVVLAELRRRPVSPDQEDG